MITELDKNTALVLIDLQKGIVGFPLAHPVEGILKNSTALVAAFHKAGLPVVVVNVNPAGSKAMQVRKEPSNAPAPQFKSDWLEIVEEIGTNADDIFVTKSTWGAFESTDIDAELQKRGVTGIVLAGIATSIGVEGTARGANARGYNITFAKDAMTDMFAEAHEHSFKYIFPRIGEIDTTENILKFL